jgi:hypothetical protein
VKTVLIPLLFALASSTAQAHRLDEYLQATLVSIDKTRMYGEMTLTPGVAVFAPVLAEIDTDRDGALSQAERRAYGERVLRDLSITSDATYVTSRLLSIRFPTVEEMKAGTGAIQLDFAVDLPPGGRKRRLTIESHHESRISAYLVNCLVPKDPAIRIASQSRNYSQSVYSVEYEQTGEIPMLSGLLRPRGGWLWLGPIWVILLGRFVFPYRRRDGSGVRSLNSAPDWDNTF